MCSKSRMRFKPVLVQRHIRSRTALMKKGWKQTSHKCRHVDSLSVPRREENEELFHNKSFALSPKVDRNFAIHILKCRKTLFAVFFDSDNEKRSLK